MFKNLISFFLIINLCFTDTAIADIEVDKFGTIINSDFRNLVNSSLPWCKKKFWGDGYKKIDNCWLESAWFENISDNYFDRNIKKKTLSNFVNGYAGEWKNDKFHGKGVQIFPDRIIVGNWQENDISFGTIYYFDQNTRLTFYQNPRIRVAPGGPLSDEQNIFIYNNDSFLNNNRDYSNYWAYTLIGYKYQKGTLLNQLNQNVHRFEYHGEIKDLQPHGKGEIRIQDFVIKSISKSVNYPYKIAGNFKDGQLIDRAKLFFKHYNKELPDLELDIGIANERLLPISINQMKAYCDESEILFSGNILLPVSDNHSHFNNIPVLPLKKNSGQHKEIRQMVKLDDEYTIKYDYGDFFISVISSKNLKKIDKELIQDLSIHKKNQILSGDIKEISPTCYPNNLDFNEEKPITIISSEGTYTGRVRADYINYRYGSVGDRNNIGYRKYKGTFEYPDGSVFKGRWINDKKDGYGEFIKKDGTVIKQEWSQGSDMNQIRIWEKAEQKKLAQIDTEILLQKGANLALNPENLKKCERFFNEYMKQFLFLKTLDRYQYNLNENIAKKYLLNCLKDPNLYLVTF